MDVFGSDFQNYYSINLYKFIEFHPLLGNQHYVFLLNIFFDL